MVCAVTGSTAAAKPVPTAVLTKLRREKSRVGVRLSKSSFCINVSGYEGRGPHGHRRGIGPDRSARRMPVTGHGFHDGKGGCSLEAAQRTRAVPILQAIHALLTGRHERCLQMQGQCAPMTAQRNDSNA